MCRWLLILHVVGVGGEGDWVIASQEGWPKDGDLSR